MLKTWCCFIPDVKYETNWLFHTKQTELLSGWKKYNIQVSKIEGTSYSEGETIFYPLLILYVCSLTKKLSVYNFNSRFILTVRDRIVTKNPEKHISKKL